MGPRLNLAHQLELVPGVVVLGLVSAVLPEGLFQVIYRLVHVLGRWIYLKKQEYLLFFMLSYISLLKFCLLLQLLSFFLYVHKYHGTW